MQSNISLTLRDLKKTLSDEKNSASQPEHQVQEKKGFFLEKLEIVKFTMDLINQHGFLSLYDGMTSSILGSVVQYAVYFCSSKYFGYAFEYTGISMGNLSRTMIINLISAICTAIVTNPIWVVNAQMAKKSPEVRKILLS